MILSASISQASDAIRNRQRARALDLLGEALSSSGRAAHFEAVANLAREIGAVDIAVEAARKMGALGSSDLEMRVKSWEILDAYGQNDEIEHAIRSLPAAQRNHPAILEQRARLAMERGEFAEAEKSLRAIIAQHPFPFRAWLLLASIKTFDAGDPDIVAMEACLARGTQAPADARAALHYALGKAMMDGGDAGGALDHYQTGASLRRQTQHYDRAWMADYATNIIRDFTPDSLATLRPSGFAEQRVHFVVGMPRSGSTLLAQLLSGHSSVERHAELDLLPRCMLDLAPPDYDNALAYQEKSQASDPWGAIAASYHQEVGAVFGAGGSKIIDKTLPHSFLVPLLLHSMPEAKIMWIRRAPEDGAWSCFRTFFMEPTVWSWSLEDIAHYRHLDDRLHAHMTSLFPDRIATVDYAALVTDPQSTVDGLTNFLGLPDEQGIVERRQESGAVKTASLTQVRAPITTDRIGLPPLIDQFMDGFRIAYDGFSRAN